jgi:hypothetical protein
MTTLIRLFANIGVPLVVAGCFWALIATSEARGIAVWVALGAFLVVMGLWLAFRRLQMHASATRLIGAGQADEVIELARGQLEWRRTERGKAPFRIYLAWGYLLRGDLDEADRVLGQAAPGRAALDRLWATAKIAALVERGTGGMSPVRTVEPDTVGEARRVYDRHIAPLLVGAPAPAVKLLADEASAKLRFAEGDAAGARPIFEKLCKEIRLGPASRAMAHWYAARCALVTGDRAGAAAHLDKAAALAPKTFLPVAVAALRAA